MSSGMNTEQAKEYAKTMTYRQAISNVGSGKFIKYRKATMIKLRELAEIADRLDRKTEPQLTEKCPFDDSLPCKWVCTEYGKCKYKPKTEREGE